MATIQKLLDDIDLRYRNTFQVSQKLVWMNEEQRELFEILELDSVPFSFSTVSGQYLYPIPNGVEIDRIKVMTIQVNDKTSPDFEEIPFMRNDNNQYADESDYWYSKLEGNFYINVPNAPVNNRKVYIYLDQQPEDITSINLSSEPSVPVRYQELLKIGVLIRIASARKDTLMRNNYDAEYQEKISDMQWKMKMGTPEFDMPIDVSPYAGQNRRYNHYLRRRC